MSGRPSAKATTQAKKVVKVISEKKVKDASKKQLFNHRDVATDYFESRARAPASKTSTSDSKSAVENELIKDQRFFFQSVETTVKHVPPIGEDRYLQAMQELTSKENFNKWSCALMNFGYSLLFYGFGSKQGLLEQFADTLPGFVTCIDGFDSALTLKKHDAHVYFTELLMYLLNQKNTSRQLYSTKTFNEIMTHLFKVLQTITTRVTFVIHNIESPHLDSLLPHLLKCVEKSPMVRIVASVDNLSWPMKLFTFTRNMRLLQFKFIKASTYREYRQEVFLNLMHRSSNTKHSRVKRATAQNTIEVLRGLTQQHNIIMWVLLEHYKKKPDPEQKASANRGLTFQELYEEVEEHSKANVTEERVNTSMVELTSHEIVVEKKVKNTRTKVYTMLHAPEEMDLIRDFLETYFKEKNDASLLRR